MTDRPDALIVFREADPATGGLGIDVADVARGMAGAGHRVEVLTMRAPGGAAPDLGPDVSVHAVESWLHRRPGVAFGLTGAGGRAVRRRRPRLVHLYSCLPVHLHWATLAAAHRAGVPVVWTPMFHPARRALWRGQGAKGRLMGAWDALAPRAARWSDLVCAATRAEARHFRALGAPRVGIVPPAVPATARVSDAEAAALRARLGLGDGPLVLCVAGRPDHRKGLDFAAEAIAALRRRRPDARLGMVGLPGDVPLAAADGVSSLGRLSLADLQRAYRAADVVFVPSRYEAFSRVVVEGWQQGRPVVVTDGVALAEEVRHGGGAVVPFGDAEAAADALAAYLADPARAARDGDHGARLVAERYEVPRVLESLAPLWAEVAR